MPGQLPGSGRGFQGYPCLCSVPSTESRHYYGFWGVKKKNQISHTRISFSQTILSLSRGFYSTQSLLPCSCSSSGRWGLEPARSRDVLCTDISQSRTSPHPQRISVRAGEEIQAELGLSEFSFHPSTSRLQINQITTDQHYRSSEQEFLLEMGAKSQCCKCTGGIPVQRWELAVQGTPALLPCPGGEHRGWLRHAARWE